MAMNGDALGRELVAAYVRAGKIPEDQADDPDTVESMVIMATAIIQHIQANAQVVLSGVQVATTVDIGNNAGVTFPDPFNILDPAASVTGTATDQAGTVTGTGTVT